MIQIAAIRQSIGDSLEYLTLINGIIENSTVALVMERVCNSVEELCLYGSDVYGMTVEDDNSFSAFVDAVEESGDAEGLEIIREYVTSVLAARSLTEDLRCALEKA